MSAETRKCERSVWDPGFTFFIQMKFEYGSINFEELKSFERRRENARVYFSDKRALPIVIVTIRTEKDTNTPRKLCAME